MNLNKSHEKIRKESLNKYLFSKRIINEHTFSQFKKLISSCIQKGNNDEETILKIKSVSVKFKKRNK